MQEKTTDPTKKQQEYLLGFLIISLFSAFSGAFFGGVAAGVFGRVIAGIIGFPIAWWQGALIGGAIGFASGLLRGIQEVRRASALEKTSTQLGLKPLADETARHVESKITHLLDQDVHLVDAYFLSAAGTDIVVSDLRIERRQTANSDDSKPDLVQTCVFFQFEEFEFPRFALQPEGRILRWMQQILGGQDIDFEDSPRFSDSYQLAADHEESARRLFSQAVRDHFEQHPGLQVVGGSHQLLFFRPNKLVKADNLDSFVQLAMQTVDLLQEQATDFVPEDLRPAAPKNKQEAIEQLDKIGGMAGMLLRHSVQSRFLDRQQLQDFLRQPTPRTIPPELKRRFGVDPFLMIFSGALLVMGLIILMVGLFGSEDGAVQIEFLLVSSVAIIGIGAIIQSLCWSNRSKKIRVLRDGEIVPGVVQSIQDSGWVIGNEQVHEAKFLPHGSSTPVSTFFRGCNLDRAHELAKTGEVTQLLCDKENASNNLLIECYSI